MSRKEKTEELLRKHEPLFKILKINDPLFILKNAYFISGKKGRFIQLFESEVSKEKDIYMEFVNKELKPDLTDRPLFKLKYNPFYKEEYEMETKMTEEGREYDVYIVSVSELIVILEDSSEISYSLYESGLYEKVKVSPFPDFNQYFEKEYLSKEVTLDDILVGEDAPINDMSISDFAAIIWKKPVSNKVWLNSLIEKNNK
jgi:hypothetical protein